MLKKKREKKLNNEEGSGLVLALMVLLVLSVLGASLGVLTVGSFKLGDINRDSNSAYYIAEAGANIAYEEFKENVNIAYADSSSETLFFNSIEDIEDTYGDGVFGTQFADQPTATITTEARTAIGEERDYIIKSTGEIAGKKRTVEKKIVVTWKKKSTGGGSLLIPERAVIIAKEKVDTQGDNQIFGGAYSKEMDLAGVLAMDGGDVYSKKIVVDTSSNISVGWLENPRESDLYSEILEVKSGSSMVIGRDLYSDSKTSDLPKNMAVRKHHPYSSGNSEGVFENIDTLPTRIENYVKPLRDKEMAEFKLNKGKNTTEKIYYKAGNLGFQDKTGTIIIEDKNVVIFADELDFQGSTLDVDGNGTLTIIVSGTIDFQDAVFNLNKANVRIISTGDRSIQIENQKRVSSISAQIIAPNSTFEMQAKTNNKFKSDFHGSVIAKNMKLQTDYLSKNILIYKEFEFDSPNIEDGIDYSDVDLEDLISPEPAIESGK